MVDTKSVTVGEHILVDYALRLVDEGRTAAEVAAAVEAAVDRVCVVGLLDTLEYLKRGGRISAAAGTVGELLSIKPVITIDDGEVAVLGKARGSKNGRNLLRQQVENAGGIDFSMPVMLGYSGLSDKLLRKYVKDSRSVWEGNIAEDDIPTLMVGATIGTHVGPGAVAVAFFKLPSRAASVACRCELLPSCAVRRPLRAAMGAATSMSPCVSMAPSPRCPLRLDDRRHLDGRRRDGRSPVEC